MDKLTHSRQAEFISRYDGMIFSANMRALYENTDFYNVGDWSLGAQTLPEACRDLVRRHLQDTPSGMTEDQSFRILDVGCGIGAGTEIIAKHYNPGQTFAINMSKAQAAYARIHHPEATYQVMDATQLAFVNESFDLICSVEAAFHFSSRAAFLRSALRVLKPGGRMTLTDILFKSTRVIGDWSVPDLHTIINQNDYEEICNKLGFCIEAIDDITEDTWKGFCRYLREARLLKKMGDELEDSVSQYLFVRLRKP